MKKRGNNVIPEDKFSDHFYSSCVLITYFLCITNHEKSKEERVVVICEQFNYGIYWFDILSSFHDIFGVLFRFQLSEIFLVGI